MQFCSSTVNSNFEYHHPVMCWEYIDIIASNIPQMKITAVSELIHSTYRGSPSKCWCLLRNLSFGLFNHREIPRPFHNFSKISVKFLDFPGLSRNLFKCQYFSGLSRNGRSHELQQPYKEWEHKTCHFSKNYDQLQNIWDYRFHVK